LGRLGDGRRELPSLLHGHLLGDYTGPALRGKGDCLPTVPHGTASHLITRVQKHVRETIDGTLIQDDLVAEAMWAGLNLASCGLSEQVVEPGGGRHLIGMRLSRSSTRRRCPCDLRLERAN
jgi:hypothetical protein